MERTNKRRIVTWLLIAILVTACAVMALVGLNVPMRKTSAEPETHSHDDISFTAWENTTSLPDSAGNYYLTADVTLDSTWNVPAGTTNLCLNGYGIIMAIGDKSVIKVGSGATLNVYDGGEITHYFDVHSNGYAININETEGSGRQSFVGGYVTGGQGTDYGYDRVLGGGFCVDAGTLHMYGGTVIGNMMTRDFVKGAGVWVGNGGTFIMEEGVAIKYNFSDNVGGGVCVGTYGNSSLSGTFVMNGGEISHNRAAAGGGIMLRAGNVTINGGSVEYNSVRDSSGGIDYEYQSYSTLKISGNPVINNNVRYTTEASDNVVLRGNTIPKIVISSALSSGANIHVLLGTGFPPTATTGVFTQGWSTYMFDIDPNNYFTSEAEHEIVAIGGEVYVHDHNYGDLVAATYTCDSDGMAAYYHCDECGTYFDEYKVPKTYAALQHAAGHRLVYYSRVEPTCTAYGKKEYYECSDCGKKFDVNKKEITYVSGINRLGHAYDNEHAVFTWTEDSSATYGWTATVDYSCPRCGSEDHANAYVVVNNATWSEDSYIYAYYSFWDDTSKSWQLRSAEKKYRDSDIGTAIINQWTPWEYDDHLPTGTPPSGSQGWYLTKDVTLTQTWTVPASMKLCLNGHVITMTGSGSAIYVPLSGTASGRSFTLCEYNFDETHYYYVGKTVNGLDFVGQIVDDENDPNYIAAARKGSFKGGYVTGGTGRVIGGKTYGGAVYVEGDSSKSYIYSSKFNMEGGTLFGNTADYGGAVYVAANAFFYMKGGNIVGNQAGSEGGGVYANKRNYNDSHQERNYGMQTVTTVDGIRYNTIANNTAGQNGNGYGGGIAGWAKLEYSYAQVFGNAAVGTSAKGGALYGFLFQDSGSFYNNYSTGVAPGVYVTNLNMYLAGTSHLNFYNNFYASSVTASEITLTGKRGDLYFATGYTIVEDSSYDAGSQQDGVRAYVEMQSGTGNFSTNWSADNKAHMYFAANVGYKINQSGTTVSLASGNSGDVNVDLTKGYYIYTSYYGFTDGSSYATYTSDESHRYVFSGTRTLGSYYYYVCGHFYDENNIYLRFNNLDLTAKENYPIFYFVSSYGDLNVYIELVGNNVLTTNGSTPAIISGDNNRQYKINIYFTGTGTLTYNNTNDPHGMASQNFFKTYDTRDVHVYYQGGDITIYERVAQLIEAIDWEITFTKEIKARIDTARAAYDALESDALREKVANREYLFYAERAYKLAAVQATIDFIDQIPDTITLTPECKEAIDKAREAYDYLDDEEVIEELAPDIPQELVSNRQKLFDAEEAYAALQLNEWNQLVNSGIALPDNLVYDGDPKVVTLTYDDTVISVTLVYQKKNGNNEYEAIDSCVGAGDYKAIIYSAVNGEPVNTEVFFTIAKADATIPTGLEAEYGQTLADVDLPEGWVWDDDLTTVVGNVGAQTFTVSYAETDNYKAANAVEVTITVGKGNPSADDFDFTAPEDLTYTGSEKAALVATEQTGMGEITVRYYTAPARENEITEIKNAGTYYVGITVAAGDNYDATSAVVYADDWTFMIAQVDASADDFNYTAPENLNYSGSAKAASVTTTKSGMGEITVKYYSDASRETEVSPTNAGTYYVGITTAEGINYNATSAVIYADDWTFTIVKIASPEPNVTPDTIDVGENLTLADVELPDGWRWVLDPTTPVGEMGEHQFEAVYNPDRTNYVDYDQIATVTLTVKHLHNNIIFTAWESTNSLPTSAGNYYLTADVTLGSAWNVPTGTTNLCLNGFGIKVTGTDSVIYVASGRTLNIYDCGETMHYFDVYSNGNERYAININETEGNDRHSFVGGYITGGQGKDNRTHGGGIYIDGGTCNLYGGNIIGNTVKNTDNCGAGVFLQNSATFRMYGGSINYNYAQNAGCAIFGWKNSTVEIHGGEIAYNKTAHSYGSAISFYNPSGYTVSLKLYGGFIHDNLTKSGGGAVNLTATGLTVGLKGNPIVRDNATVSTDSNATLNVHVGSTPINIEGALTSEAKIRIRLASGTGTFTSGWSTYMSGKDPADYFVSEAGYDICLFNGEAYCGVPVASVTNGDTTTCYATFADALNAWTENTTLTLLADVTTASTITVNVTKTLDLNGYGITMTGSGSVISISSSGALTLNDSNAENQTHYYTVASPKENGAGLATVCDEATYNSASEIARGTFTGGYITGGSAVAGAGVCVNNGTLYMNGGTIIGNTATGSNVTYGGGVALRTSNDAFTMAGGAIIGNTALCGGGVSVYLSSAFTMSGGEIKYNYSTGNGGGIHTDGQNGMSSVTISGGSIINNATVGNSWGKGGAILLSNASLTISGSPVITDNMCNNAANNVYFATEQNQSGHAYVVGALDANTVIGVTMKAVGVFTESENTTYNAISNFVSDDENYIVAKNADGQLYLGEAVASVTVGDTTTKYASLIDAYEACPTGGTIKLLTHLDIRSLGDDVYLDVQKDITFDLNGYELSFNYTATTSQITLSGGHVLTLDNGAPDNGGVNGMVVVDAESYILLKNCRLRFTKAQLESSADINHIAEGFTIEEIGEDYFHSLVRPFTKQELIQIVIDLIDEIPDPVEDTHECKTAIDAAREAYDDLSDDDKEEVTNRQTLFDAEDEYARLHNVKWMIKMRAKANVPSEYAAYLAEGEKIVRVYDVTLYRIAIDNGVEQEPVLAQPSDIKAGATITVKLTIPDILEGKTFRILHVHGANDYTFVEYETDADGKHVTIHGVDRLSDFAFVAMESDLNPSEQGSDEQSQGVKPLDVEPEITQEDDPNVDNWSLTPQGGEGEQGQGGQEQSVTPAASVALEDTAPEDAEGVTVEVEVKTEVSEEVTQSENNVLDGSLQSDDEIAIVYEVKLIRTTIENGVEVREEIQPSDIKPGTIVVINMVIPEGLRGKPFKLLHIHSEEDIKEVTSYTVSEDGTTVTVRVDRLSEFAFVGKAAAGGNGEGGNGGNGEEAIEPNKLSDGAIAGIVIGGSFGVLLLGLLIFFLLLKISKKDDDGDKVVSEEAEAADERVTLKENIAVARATVSHSAVNKQYIADYLKLKYAADVEINRRGNETKTGLPLADTHYVVTDDGKTCFVYVYEIEGTTMLLVKVGDEYGKALTGKHPIVKRSAFPKSKSAWYSVIADDGFASEEIEKILDDAYAMNGGKQATDEGLSLKETLAMAKVATTTIQRTKKGIADFLAQEYGDKAELNLRGNETKTGLPLADTHYAISDKGKKCFVYVYETDGTVVLLLRLTETYAESVRAGGHKITRSAFPKSKDSWYTVILDDTYSEADIRELLVDAYNMAE